MVGLKIYFSLFIDVLQKALTILFVIQYLHQQKWKMTK